MIMVSLVVGSFGSGLNKDLVAVARIVVLGGTFLFALHTSDAKRSMYYASFALIAISIAASVIVSAGTKTGDAVDSIAGFLVVLGALFTILRRFEATP